MGTPSVTTETRSFRSVSSIIAEAVTVCAFVANPDGSGSGVNSMKPLIVGMLNPPSGNWNALAAEFVQAPDQATAGITQQSARTLRVVVGDPKGSPFSCRRFYRRRGYTYKHYHCGAGLESIGSVMS